MSDGMRLHAASLELEAAQKAIDDLYTRWVELEQKLKYQRGHQLSQPAKTRPAMSHQEDA